MITINIANEFSRTPGPRSRSEGPHSGEEFRETILRPSFERAVKTDVKLVIELDGVKFGYPTSFLEESFGGLARIYGIVPVLERLIFHSSEEPSLRQEITNYIKDAQKTSQQRVSGAAVQ